ESPRLPIVIVSIDEDSFDEINLPWPWPRSLHAQLIHKLIEARARLIALDIVIDPEGDPAEDAALADAINEAGNVILAAAYTEAPSAFGPKRRMVLPIPSIRQHAMSYGPVNLMTDPDGVVRAASTALVFQDREFPHFAYRIYEAVNGNGSSNHKGASSAPTIINYRGPGRTYPVVPYYRILRDEIDPLFFRDKIVMVGTFAPILHDVFPTPFSANKPTAGVEIQANLVETMVSGSAVRPLRSWGHWTLFLAMCLVSLWLSAQFRPFLAMWVIAGFVTAFVLASFYFFWAHQVWIPVVPSLLGVALVYGGINLDNYVGERQERMRVRNILGKYVSPDVMEEILKDRRGLSLGGKRKHITVLFSDIRGFTSLSERIQPEQVITLLSDYLAQVTHIIFKHGGTVDKFIGDAVMAIFGAPNSHEDDATRAVRAGLDMIQLAESVSPQWAGLIGSSLKIGVGINSGEAVVGSIGSEVRSDFTAIGDTVNLASRLEALTKEMKVPMLVSEFTAEEVAGEISLNPLGQVKVTGRETSLQVYCPESLIDPRVENVGTQGVYEQKHK
nr:CHASE2 domain-containing protein [Deltaproteobacteria bacterium]